MQQIQQIDAELTRLFSDFEKTAERLNFQTLGDLQQVDLQSIQFSGLYFFEVWSPPYGSEILADWLSCFTAQWNQDKEERSFVPSCQKARMKQHTMLKEWMPLYLGKSQKIGHRVWEHINLPAKQSTFAMKLKARNLLEGNKYRLSVLPLSVKNYAVLAPKIEAALRRKYLPIVGRQ